MKQILYVYPNSSSFIKKDIRLLSKNFNVRTSSFIVKSKIILPLLLIIQFFKLLFVIPKSDIVICKFAAYHSFIPILLAKVFGVKSILINGGTDCVSFPSIGYGSFNKPVLKHFVRWTYHLTSHIVTLHKNLVEYDYTYTDLDFPKQGFQYHMPKLKKPITEIFNGYSPKQWKRVEEKESNSYLTVASGIGDARKNMLKGIDLIMAVAPKFPECTFYLVGANEDFILDNKQENIIAIGPLPQDELIHYFGKAQFYFQLSISEGFPNALSEAMLCECIPIGSNVGAIADIIGDTGMVLKKKGIDGLERIIHDSISCNKTELQKAARQRIIDNFSEEKREHKLNDLIKHLLAAN